LLFANHTRCKLQINYSSNQETQLCDCTDETICTTTYRYVLCHFTDLNSGNPLEDVSLQPWVEVEYGCVAHLFYFRSIAWVSLFCVRDRIELSEGNITWTQVPCKNWSEEGRKKKKRVGGCME
jgi:hypothetical protein